MLGEEFRGWAMEDVHFRLCECSWKGERGGECRVVMERSVTGGRCGGRRD